MSALTTSTLAELSSLIVEGRFVEDPALLTPYEVPIRGERGRARFAVEPGSQAEVASVAKWAYQNRARLVVQGANTGLVGASTPDATGHQGILRLERLNRVIDFSPGDRVAIVEAGLTLDELNETLAPEGLFLPIEVGSNPSIGGLVATNAAGARTIRHGDMGRRVLGLEAVVADPQGSTIGKVGFLAKDNSRLNLSRLFIGSFGSLGVVTRVAVRLAVRPSSVATAIIAVGSPSDAVVCLDHLERRLGDALGAFEMMSGDAVRITLENVDGLQAPFVEMTHDGYVLVEAQAYGDGDIESVLAECLDSLASHPASPMVDAIIGPAAHLWKLRHAQSWGVRGSADTVRFDISVPRVSLPSLRPGVEALLADEENRPVVAEFGHWGDGGTHLDLVYDDPIDPSAVHRVREKVYDLVVGDLGGSFSAEHGLGPYNASFYERYVPAEERALALRLKAMLDPRGVWGSEPFVSER